VVRALSGYAQLLRTPEVPRLAGSSLALGIAGTMAPVSFVLFAHRATGSFGDASLVFAASTTGGLLAAPLRGRLVDRIGPSAAVLRLVVPSATTDIAFILAGHARLATGLLVALALLAGAIIPPGGAALLSVWSELLAGSDSRQSAYALMSVLQEVGFIAGPLLAGGIIALWSTTAAVAAAAALSLAGGLAFASAPAARARGPREDRRRERLMRGGGLQTVLLTAAAFGLTFGALDVAFPAFAREHGSSAAAGVLLSALAAGMLAGSLVFGLRSSQAPPGPRYPALCLLAAAGLAPLAVAPGLVAAIVLAFVAGTCFAPISVCQFAVISEVAPAGRTGEAFTWLGTFYGAGLAAGAALAGQLVAATDPRVAMAAACAATAAAWLVATVRAGTLAPAPAVSARPTPP
jgi:MFS family permease